jgi:hypothetical protein
MKKGSRKTADWQCLLFLYLVRLCYMDITYKLLSLPSNVAEVSAVL